MSKQNDEMIDLPGLGPAIRVETDTFLALKNTGRIIDVRSPGEYEHGHIPGAINAPLFDDEGRAEVGTLYKKRGKKAAITRGFELVAPRLEELRQTILRNAKGKAIRIHCWRGGMRSESVAWLAQRSGLTVYLLKNGYKAYRHSVLEAVNQELRLRVISGLTGAGKTDALLELEALGQQVIDLEGLANHKGSAFGALGQEKQPTTEQFENNLHEKLGTLNLRKGIYIEDESKSIGRVFLPEALHLQMAKAPTIILDTPYEARVERLVKDYTDFPKEEIIESIERLTKRLGGQRVKECREAVLKGDFQAAVREVLGYYDKQYDYLIATKHPNAPRLELKSLTPSAIAEQLITQDWEALLC